METIIGEVDVDLKEIHKTILPDIPPWTIRTPNINLTHHKFHTNKPNFPRGIRKIKKRCPKHPHIFMDESKLEEMIGCATVYKGKIFF